MRYYYYFSQYQLYSEITYMNKYFLTENVFNSQEKNTISKNR